MVSDFAGRATDFGEPMRTSTRKFNRIPVYTLVLMWALYFCVGFTFHYHPTYNHAHAGQLQPHDHPGHFHSHEVERIASAINPDASPLLPGETHHHSESTPGGDSETLQLELNKHSLLPLKFKVAFTAAVIQVIHQEDDRIVHEPVPLALPFTKTRHLPLSISGRAPPAILS